MNVTVCVEGGGDASTLKRQCRKGFSDFFRNAGLSGRMPRIIAGGARENTYKDFRTALAKATDHHDFVVLLVDSEGPTAEGIGVWAYLKSRDQWEPPEGVADDSAHLMVQCMEAWFLADKEALAGFFGTGFHANALPGRIDIENVPKKRLLDAIENATRQCRTKGRYDKGRHSFQLLGQLDPEKVTLASPYARRLISTLMSKASEDEDDEAVPEPGEGRTPPLGGR